MKTKKIIFFNAKSEVDDYFTAHSGKEEGVILVAMNPGTNVYLKAKDFEPHDTRRYFTNDSHERVLGVSKGLTEWLRRESSLSDLGLGVERAYKDVLIFWVRHVIHHCAWATEIVSRAVEVHRPEIICASVSGKKYVRSLYIEAKEKVPGILAEMIARQKGIVFEDLSHGHPDAFLPLETFGSLMDETMKYLLRRIKFSVWVMRVLNQCGSGRERPVFFTTKFYQMGRLLERMRSESPGLKGYFFGGPVIPQFRMNALLLRVLGGRSALSLIDQERKMAILREKIVAHPALFAYGEISFAGILAEKMKRMIAPHILGLSLWTVTLDRALDKLLPKVLISNGNRADDLVLAELCRKKGIPDILISHGSHTPPKNEYERIEWGEHGMALMRGPFSVLALQSPLSEEYLRIFPSEAEAVKTGPLIWGKAINRESSRALFRKMFGEKYAFGDIRIVLHAATPKASNRLRLFVFETPDEYIQSIRDLIEAAKGLINTVLIIKFRPSAEIDTEDLKKLVPFSEKVILSIEEPFLDVLGMSDLLVSFSSTTIEEALQNRIPVLLYGGVGRYRHVPAYEIASGAPVLRSAAYHVKEAKDLASAISGILSLKEKGTDGALFDPYIYKQDVRIPLADLTGAGGGMAR